MRVRVISLSVAPGELEELTDTYQNSLLPELRQLQGISSLLLLCDDLTGKVIELTLFDDEDAIRESEEDGGMLDRKLGTLMQRFDTAPDVETFNLEMLS